MDAILRTERRLLDALSNALESGRNVAFARQALGDFYSVTLGSSMLAKREKLAAEVLGR